MFRIIAENKNHILIEGIEKIKIFKTELVIVSVKGVWLEILGEGFYIDELGEGYIRISGDISAINYKMSESDL